MTLWDSGLSSRTYLPVFHNWISTVHSIDFKGFFFFLIIIIFETVRVVGVLFLRGCYFFFSFK